MASRKTQTKRNKRALLNLLWLVIPIAAFVAVGVYIDNDYRPPKPLAPPPADALYRSADQLVSDRVEDLLSRMTIEEKIGQMAVVDKNSLRKPEDIAIYGLGGVISGAGAKPEKNTPEGWLKMVDDIKQNASESRLGIPVLFGIDATHGHANVPGATVFPHAIGLGASGDAELVKLTAIATAQELAATGVNWNFAPVLDAPEDIRWGRTYESFSSDPDLNARLGSAYVEGLGANVPVLSSAKHFLGIGSMNWGESNNKNFEIDQGKITEDSVKLEEYLIPYRAVINAGVDSIMVGLAEYGGKRIIDSEELITGKLKGELRFDGIVVSDWFGVYEYSGTNRYNANVKTINAGLDMVMLPFDYKIFMKDMVGAVENGDISQARIDDAVRRIITKKVEAGLFDIEYPADLTKVGSPSHRELARKAVSASAVLLKNDEILPLAKNTKHIRVTGSGANNVGRQAGAWTVEWQGIDGNWLPGSTSVLSAINSAVGEPGAVEFDELGYFSDGSAKADVGIAIVSEKPYAEGWGDNGNPTLSDEDKLAIKRLSQAAEKVVIVIISGRPLLMSEEIRASDAVVAAWLPGSEGAGIADVLFGDKPFTAKLPIDWPRSLSQIPIRTNGSTADGTEPLYRRGFGLTTDVLMSH